MDADNSFAHHLLKQASLRPKSDSNEAHQKKSSDQALHRRYSIQNANDVQIVKKIITDYNNNESSCVSKEKLLEILALGSFSEIPIMEPTGKFAVLDSTEIMFTPHSMSIISTISVFVEISERDNDSEEIIASSINFGSDVYNEDNFLENALGDELNNTSVTYYNSCGLDRTNSDFNASDLMSEQNFSMNENVEEISSIPMSRMQPQSSSTLNRTINLKPSVWNRMRKNRSERVSKLRSFFRLPRRFIQDFKKVIGLKASS